MGDLVVRFQKSTATSPRLSTLSAQLASLINANFGLRDRIFHVAEENRRMVMVAQSVGASAKFAGSGGAIVGTYEGAAQFDRHETEARDSGRERVRTDGRSVAARRTPYAA